MSFDSRLRPVIAVSRTRRHPKGKEVRGNGAGGRNVRPFETLENRRLLSGTYTMSGLTEVNEGDYQLTLSVQGVDPATVQQWNIDWNGDGTADEWVNPNGAASVTVTRNLDGDGEIRVVAKATLTDSTVVVAESPNHTGYLDPTFAVHTDANTIPGTKVDELSGLPKSVVIDSQGRTIVAFQEEGAVRLRRYGASGEVDSNFGNEPVQQTANVGFVGNTDSDQISLLIHGGMLYVGGMSHNAGGNADFAVARLGLETGTPDTSFGNSGVKLIDLGAQDSINALATQGTEIIAVGHSSGTFKMVRLLGDGSLDGLFGSSGVVTRVGWQGTDVVVLSDQSIVAAGPSTATTGASLVVEKFSGAGVSAWPFTPTPTQTATHYGLQASIAVQNDGKIVVAGDHAGDVSLVRLNADGTLDAGFGNSGVVKYNSGGFDSVYDVLLQPDGTIVTAGGAAPDGSTVFALTGFGPSGFLDTTFGADFNDAVANGKRDVGEGLGHTYTAVGPISEIRAAAVTAGGSIVATGYSGADPGSKIALARYGRDLGVSVWNVEPQLVVTDAMQAVPGHRHVVIEPSDADRAAGYQGYIDFDYHAGDADGVSFGGNDLGTGAFVGAPLPGYPHTAAGTYTVYVSIIDKDSWGSEALFSIGIGNTAIQSDPANPGGTMLLVGAFDGADGVGVNNTITVGGDSTGTSVSIDGIVTTQPATGRVLVYGNGGADEIKMQASFATPVELYGGAGDDTLKSGSANDILIGGDGADLLYGRDGRDLLVGDSDYAAGKTGWADTVIGNQDDDILIGGFYASSEDRVALAAVIAEWGSARTFSERVDNLRNTNASAARLNSNFFLIAGTTVFDDGVSDSLKGMSGTDWYFANVDGATPDSITKLTEEEKLALES